MASETLTCSQKTWALLGLSRRNSSRPQTVLSWKSLSNVTWEQAEHALLRNLQKRMCLCRKNTFNILKMPAASTTHLVQGGLCRLRACYLTCFFFFFCWNLVLFRHKTLQEPASQAPRVHLIFLLSRSAQAPVGTLCHKSWLWNLEGKALWFLSKKKNRVYFSLHTSWELKIKRKYRKYGASGWSLSGAW